MCRWRWLLLVVPSLALAQTPRAFFDEGTALYARGQFAKAAEKFEASYAARPVPVTMFNIARSWEQAGQTLKAIGSWQAWLVMSPAAPERPEVVLSLQRLGDRLAKLGVQALTITSLPLSARVVIDGAPRGVTPLTVELTPTRHLVRLELEGREPQERAVEFSLAHPAVETFELAPAGQLAPSLLQAQPAPDVTAPVPFPRPAVPRPTDPDFAFSLGDDAVHVHIETNNREVRLYRSNGNPNGECRAPCDVTVVRAADLFTIGGMGIVSSNPFVLADHRKNGKVRLKVGPGNAGLFFGGGTILSTIAIAGLSIALAFGLGQSSDKGLPVALGLGLGVPSAIGAIALFATNGTKVEFNPD
ncbi:MAG: PEGA domain-containing protein [Archangium sp.]|nr:PEGA domain-containing protein [Archangium sp.]